MRACHLFMVPAFCGFNWKPQRKPSFGGGSPQTYINTYLPTYVHACIYIYIHIDIDVDTHTCMHACRHTYMHACMSASIHTYNTYIHTCVCIYIYTCIHAYNVCWPKQMAVPPWFDLGGSTSHRSMKLTSLLATLLGAGSHRSMLAWGFPANIYIYIYVRRPKDGGGWNLIVSCSGLYKNLECVSSRG